MSHAVIVPLGVPKETKGLGVGLAALVHSFAQVDGRNIALAQLFSKEGSGISVHPIEAFVAPPTWKDLTTSGNGPEESVSVVVTGAFEPPDDSDGALHLLAFEPENGKTIAKVEVPIEPESAGKDVSDALSMLCKDIRGDLGLASDIADLDWTTLESVLLAERCALHDPHRGGPHDKWAALAHFERAVGEAPNAKYPAGRLAAFALDIAAVDPSDDKLSEVVHRVLCRSLTDAPLQLDLVEAVAAIEVRMGDLKSAENRVNGAIDQDPARTRFIALRSEIHRLRKEYEPALIVLDGGLRHHPKDLLLQIERSLVLSELGRLDEASFAFKSIIETYGPVPIAYGNLAILSAKRQDTDLGVWLVDRALEVRDAHVECLRRALDLVHMFEPDGLARSSRVLELSRRLVSASPHDPQAHFLCARAFAQSGDRPKAKEHIARVISLSPDSLLAAEAERGRFAIDHPEVSEELDKMAGQLDVASSEDLASMAIRARGLAIAYDHWSAYFVVGQAEKKLGNWAEARVAFESLTKLAPGHAPAWLDLAEAYSRLGEFSLVPAAVDHATALDSSDAVRARINEVMAIKPVSTWTKLREKFLGRG